MRKLVLPELLIIRNHIDCEQKANVVPVLF